MKRPNMKGEPPALVAAFKLRGAMIDRLARKCAKSERTNATLRAENTKLRERVRVMAGHR